MRIHSVLAAVWRSMVVAAAGMTSLMAGGCLTMDEAIEAEPEAIELEVGAAAITGGAVDVVASGSVSGNLVACASKNLGPGTIQSTDSWATGVALKNKWGSTIFYAWVSHGVNLAPSASVGFNFDAAGAYWRSPQDVSFYGPVGSLSGYAVDCIANAGVVFRSNPTETYVTPAAIPESDYSNDVKTVKKSTN